MRGLFSHLKSTGLLFTVTLFLPFCPTIAEDIEIDLGGNSAPNAKSFSTGIGTKTHTSKPKETELGSTTLSEDKLTKSPTQKLSKLNSVVNKVSVSSEGNEAKIIFEGENLPLPDVTKISSQKVLIKLLNTKLKIRQKIVLKNHIVKSIRSSSHSGNTAWIVLDVTRLEKWDLNPSKTGYTLILNPLGTVVSTEEIKKSEPAVANENALEKRIFFRLIDTSFKPVEKGMKIVLTSDGPSKYTVRKLSQPDKLVIRFYNTKLEIPEKLTKFKSGNFELDKGGVVQMELRQIGLSYSPTSEVILTLLPGTTPQIDRDLNQVVITLSAPPILEKPIEKRGNLNQLVSLDIEAADLNAVIKTLASESGFDVDFVAGPLLGVVNEKFRDIPLKTALANLLSSGNYNFEVQGNLLRVGPQATLIQSKVIMPHIVQMITPSGGMTPDQFNGLVKPLLSSTNALNPQTDSIRNLIILNGTASDIEDYKRAIKDLKLDESSNSDRITRVVKLNYANAPNIQTILGAYLTPVGKIQLQGNSLVIWEAASNMGVLLELIKELDHKPAQVLIESNIVEIDNEKDLNVGINWSANKNIGDPTLAGSFSNLPVNAQGNAGSFTFGTIKSGLNISANLQALETHKKGKIISRPRIATESGVPAEINTVENVVIATTTIILNPLGGSTSTLTFTNLPLPIDLKVTPRITDDGRITTIINASITSQTGTAQGPGAPPPTSVQTATTTITTKNGETIVIGGLVRELAQDTINGIPLLSSLPIIGTLFQEHEKTNRKVELVIFITPTLLED